MARYLVIPAAALALCAVAQQQFQQQPQQKPPDLVLRISVALVQVDAVVTDGKGRHVTDLKASDFEILQDGKPQKVTNFSYINTTPAATSAKPAVAPAILKNAPPPPPTRLRPNQVRRTMALVVDDLGLSFESTARVRQALKKYVDEQMQPGDLVAIIRTGAGMGALQQFTADKRQLYAAIERVRYNMLGRVALGAFSGSASDRTDAEVRADEFREEFFSVGTLGAINYIVRGLKDLPGRKSVILFSENMRIIQTEGINQNILDSMQRLTDLANRSSVVIYSVDPRGLQTMSLTAADNVNTTDPSAVTEMLAQRHKDYFDSQDGMAYLAHETGGLFISENNDINNCIKQVMDDQTGYYLIGYRPAANTFDPETGRRKFHTVKVRVKRPGLHVRSRNGFFGVPEREARPVYRTRDEQLVASLSSPFSGGDIRLKLTSLFSNSPKTGSFIQSMVHINGQDIQFQDEPNGWRKGVLDVLVITFGDNGMEVDRSNRTFTIRLTGNAYKQAIENGLIYNINHPVKKPGAYQLRVAVRDATSQHVGSASQFTEVPDVKKGRLLLSGIVLKSFEQQVKPAASADAAKEGRVEEPDPRGSPALRIFAPGKALLYAYQILNAHLDSTKKPQLETSMRLFRDGKQIFAGKPAAVDGAYQPDLKRMMAGGRLRLGAKLDPGEYVLQVLVTDKLAKEKYRTAAQSIDFEVAPLPR